MNPRSLPRTVGDVSIALATCNGGRHIGAQLQSFADQSILPAELVVSDDQSTDDTVEQIERFSRISPFTVRVVRNERRLGFADNFLKTIRLCRSSFVALSDQDDVWLPTKLEVCLEILKETGAGLVVHSAALVDTDLRPLGALKQLSDRTGLLPPLSIQPLPGMAFGMTFVLARDLMDILDSERRPRSVNHPGTLLAHDEWILLLASVFTSIATTTKSLTLYRQHGQNLFGQPSLSPMSRLKFLLEVSPSRYEGRRLFALDTAALLEGAAGGLSPQHRAAAQAGAIFYGRIAQHLGERLRMCQEESALARLRHLLRILAGGGYSTRALGWRALVKDLVLNASGLRAAADSPSPAGPAAPGHAGDRI